MVIRIVSDMLGFKKSTEAPSVIIESVNIVRLLYIDAQSIELGWKLISAYLYQFHLNTISTP